MTDLIWPWRLLMPSAEQGQTTRLVGQSQSGSTAIDGTSQSARTDGGGRWQSDLPQIALYDETRVRAARAWSAMLDGGVTSFILPIWDLAYAPRPYVGGRLALPGSPPIDPEGFFSQEPGFGTPLMSASIVSAAALRATTVLINMEVGTLKLMGTHFSINHPDKGWRLYRIAMVTAVDGTQATCTIRPPLRQALAGGEAVEFDVPRCKMKLVASKADSLEPSVRRGIPTIDASFEEAA